MSAPQFQLVSGPDNLMTMPEGGSTQVFKRGDIVLASSGAVIHANASPVADAVLLGIAAQDATGTTSADVDVYIFSADQVWQTFANASVSPADLYVGTAYDMNQSEALAGEMTSTTNTTTCVLYSYKAMGQDGTTDGDPCKIRIQQDNLFDVGL